MQDEETKIDNIERQDEIIELAKTLDAADEFVESVEGILGPLKDNSSAWFYLSSLLQNVGLPGAALIICTQGLQINSNEALGWSMRGGLLNHGLKDVAMSLLRGGEEKKKVTIPYLGRELKSGSAEELKEAVQEIREKSVEAYRRATELDPKMALYWTGLGYQLTQINSDEAEDAFRRAIDLEPHDKLQWIALYDWYLKKERNEDAIALEKQAKEYKIKLKKEHKKAMGK
ncbi:MAG: hypothetical protein ACFFE2_04440 [Candidatus Thorarchaeota archaeon]